MIIYKTVRRYKTTTQCPSNTISKKNVVRNTSKKKLTKKNIVFLKSIGLKVKK